jgi:hypothetical protein
MGASTPQENRIAVLKEEINFIHVANYKYWVSPAGEHSREARAEYERRRARLEEIRIELSKTAPKLAADCHEQSDQAAAGTNITRPKTRRSGTYP